ncbi:MAG: winged helix-turn-helix domain-containing protein [Alkalispirochaeta sp.]
MQVLIVEDDAKIAQYLKKGLGESGYHVDHLESAEEALGAASLKRYDALVVDIMLPGKDGLWLIEELRGRGMTAPILILSARQSVDDRVTGLRAGGDDYLTKPFSFSELQVRIEALIRRSRLAAGNGSGGATGTGSATAGAAGGQVTRLSVGDIEMDLLARQVTRQGTHLDLQPREFSLLELFLRHPGQVLTKTMILEHVWSYDFDPQTNVVDVLVSRLRAKVDREFEPKVIHTVRGVGYAFRPESTAATGAPS